MFFKSIFVCITVVFVTVICINSRFVGDTPSLSLKKEVAKVVQCAECSITDETSRSYIITSTGENYLSSTFPAGGRKEAEDKIIIHERANSEDLFSLQNSLGYSKHTVIDLVVEINTSSTPQREVLQERSESVLVSPFAKEAL